jgi:hypothetical protein
MWEKNRQKGYMSKYCHSRVAGGKHFIWVGENVLYKFTYNIDISMYRYLLITCVGGQYQDGDL